MDPYSILGVKYNSTKDEIKAAYKKLAKQWHPDVNQNDPDAERRFKEINHAYELLTSDLYNQKRQYGNLNNEWDIWSFYNTKTRENLDITSSINMSFLDFISDKTHTINILFKDICSFCNGAGCDKCNKTGILNETRVLEFKTDPFNIQYVYIKSLDNFIVTTMRFNNQGKVRNNTQGHLNLKINIQMPSNIDIDKSGNIFNTIFVDLKDILQEDFYVETINNRKFKINTDKLKSLSDIKFTIPNAGLMMPIFNINGNYTFNINVNYPKLTNETREFLIKNLTTN